MFNWKKVPQQLLDNDNEQDQTDDDLPSGKKNEKRIESVNKIWPNSRIRKILNSYSSPESFRLNDL